MPHPVISIIIPVFNRRVLLEETLKSISSQEFKDWECIIVDDRSNDGTQEMVTQLSLLDSRFRLIIKPDNLGRGPSASRNIGLRAASGEYIHFFDSDDLLSDDFYSQIIPKILSSALDCMIVRIKWFHDDGTGEVNMSPEFKKENFIFNAIVKNHELWTQNIIWRHSLLHSEMGFNEKLTMSEDIEFAVRYLSKAKYIDFSNDIFVNIRRHPNSLTFDPDFNRRLLRNISVFDAYDAILASLKSNKSLDTRVEEYCFKVKYKSVSESLQSGLFDRKIFFRQVKLIWQSMVTLRARPFFRLLFLWPIFVAIGVRARFGSRIHQL